MAIMDNAKSDQAAEFVLVFSEMMTEQRKPVPDKRRHGKLEARVNFLFPRLTEDQKLTALIALAQMDMVPESWIEAHKVFGGTFTKIF